MKRFQLFVLITNYYKIEAHNSISRMTQIIMTILITIQGNIGGGKSTFLSYLKTLYKDKPNICFLQEPLDEWLSIRDIDGVSILELFYADQSTYAFNFQMMAYISRLAILKKEFNSGYDIIISERSLDTDRNIFEKMLYHDDKITHIEHQIYSKWFDTFKSDFPEEYVFYMRTTPEIIHERIQKRDRKGEVIPLEYLQSCHDYHETWVNSIPPNRVSIIDGDVDFNDEPEILTSWVLQFNTFLNKCITI